MLYITKKTPFIWRQFGTTFNDELELKNYFKPKILLKFFLHKLIANSSGCKAIVCTEDGCANRTLYLGKLGVSDKKLHMVKNQRTLRATSSQMTDVRLKSDKFKIVKIGRISEWKKIHLLVKAMVNIKNKYPKIAEDIELSIIGQTQDQEYEKSLKKLISDNRLENQIFFKKDLEYNQIEEILKNTDLSVSLTAYNPIIESLQNNIPVITYEYGEVGKIFDNCPAVFVLCKDIKKSSFLSFEQEENILEELENQLLDLFKQKEELKLIGKEGRKFVENNFPTLDEHVKEVSEIYLDILNQKS